MSSPDGLVSGMAGAMRLGASVFWQAGPFFWAGARLRAGWLLTPGFVRSGSCLASRGARFVRCRLRVVARDRVCAAWLPGPGFGWVAAVELRAVRLWAGCG